MEDWNREQKEREEEEKWKSQQKEEPSDEESDIDSLIRKTSQREEDYSSMSPREIHELIDEVLDDDSLSREERDRKIKTLSGFLPKESAQIFLRELERINESRSKGII